MSNGGSTLEQFNDVLQLVSDRKRDKRLAYSNDMTVNECLRFGASNITNATNQTKRDIFEMCVFDGIGFAVDAYIKMLEIENQ